MVASLALLTAWWLGMHSTGYAPLLCQSVVGQDVVDQPAGVVRISDVELELLPGDDEIRDASLSPATTGQSADSDRLAALAYSS